MFQKPTNSYKYRFLELETTLVFWKVIQYTPSGSSSIGSLIDLGRGGLDCFLGTGGSFFLGLLVWSFCNFSESRKLKLQNSIDLHVY